ncbi:MAG: molybdenum ABC transporter ATP-binding protein [Methylococcales bacterium]
MSDSVIKNTDYIGHCNVHLEREDFSLQADFKIPTKGVLGIFGHSGSGKTTILRCIAGLEKELQGSIEINGHTWLSDRINLSSQQRHIGYIFQESRLFPHMTVEKNLEYGYQRNKRTTTTNIDKKHLLELLNIGHLLNRYPHKLSGGEKQRAAIARALLKNPQMLLLDEPLAALDDQRKQEILPFLERLHDEINIPMLYVSHSLDEVSRLCDHMLVMEQGRIQFNGSLHDALISPESPLATADNAAAILEVRAISQDKEFQISTVETANGNLIQVHGLIKLNRHIRLRILANNISLCKSKPENSSILNILEGKINRVIEEKDSSILLQIDSKKDILLTRVSRKSYQQLQLTPGQAIFIQIKAVALH